MQDKIELKEFYNLFKQHRIKFFLIVFLSILTSLALMFYLIEPKYASQAQLLSTQSLEQKGQGAQLDDIQLNYQLIDTYSDVIMGESTLMLANEKLNNKYTIRELSEGLSIQTSTNSHTFYVNALMDRPEAAQEVVDAVIASFIEKVADIYGDESGSISVLSPASYQTQAVLPNPPRFAFIGLVVGVFLGMIVISISEIMDDRVKVVRDVERIGMNRIGQVNLFSNEELKKSRINHYYNKKQRGL